MSGEKLIRSDAINCEKREHPRREAHLFMVFRRLAETKVCPPEIGYTRDISARGVYFFTQSKITKGEQIYLTIHLTSEWAGKGNPPKLEGEGNVLRVEQARTTLPLPVSTGVAVRLKEEIGISFQ